MAVVAVVAALLGASVWAAAAPVAAVTGSTGGTTIDADRPAVLDPATEAKLAGADQARFLALDADGVLAETATGSVAIPLLQGTTVEATGPAGPAPGAGGTTTWSGTTGSGYATLTFAGDAVYGDVTHDGVRYDLGPASGDTHLVVTEARPFAPESPPLPVPVPDATDGAVDAAPGSADGPGATTDIRMLVVYDELAAAELGPDVADELAAMVNETNAAYARSGITARLEAVGVEPVSYGRPSDHNVALRLQELQNPSDGFLDGVHARRDVLGADLVSLISAISGTTCGIAFELNQAVPNGYPAYGFSVIDGDCAVSNYSFAHEVGHNLGANHGPSGGLYFPYSNGFRDPTHGFRTIMAYDENFCCPRVGHFSNPAVTYNGHPTGISSAFGPDGADNADTLNHTYPIAARYRGAPQPPGAASLVTGAAGDGVVTVSWSAPTVGGPPAGYTAVATPGGRTCASSAALRSCTVDGLTNGQPYTFVVLATNEGGTGPASSPSAPVTPMGTTPNDDVADATEVVLPWAGGGTNATATVEAGEPPHGGVSAPTSLWWRFTTATDAPVRVTTRTSTFDTVVAVYTGDPTPSMASLVPVAADDDGGPGGTSTVTFPSTAGTEYFVAVAGKGGATGLVALSITIDGPDGQFTGLTPKRILDSRDGTGGPGTPWGPLAVRDLVVVGGSTPVPAGATSVVLNVTGVMPTAATHLTIWPAGDPQPDASNLNLPAGTVRPNLVVVRVGEGGAVSIFNNAGSVHVIADVVGYVGPIAGSRLVGLPPHRLLDSRDGTGGPAQPWGPATTRGVPVRGGTTTVPATATAVVLNVTATNPTQSSHLTVWPAGAPFPLASNLNFSSGQTVPNLVVVDVGEAGNVSIFNNSGSVQVIADVVGYFVEDTGAGFVGITPTRVLDSRDGTGVAATRWPAATSRSFVVAGDGTPVPAGATAVVLNVTGVLPTTGTHLTVYPAGEAPPDASSLNLPAGDVRANLVMVKVGAGGAVTIFNNAGSIDVIADLVGYAVDPSP